MLSCFKKKGQHRSNPPSVLSSLKLWRTQVLVARAFFAAGVQLRGMMIVREHPKSASTEISTAFSATVAVEATSKDKLSKSDKKLSKSDKLPKSASKEISKPSSAMSTDKQTFQNYREEISQELKRIRPRPCHLNRPWYRIIWGHTGRNYKRTITCLKYLSCRSRKSGVVPFRQCYSVLWSSRCGG